MYTYIHIYIYIYILIEQNVWLSEQITSLIRFHLHCYSYIVPIKTVLSVGCSTCYMYHDLKMSVITYNNHTLVISLLNFHHGLGFSLKAIVFRKCDKVKQTILSLVK